MRQSVGDVVSKAGWTRVAPNITAFNLDPRVRPLLDNLVHDLPMEMTPHGDAFVSKREVVNSANGVKFERTTDWYSLGGIYDGNALLPEFHTRAAYYPGKFRDPPAVDKARIAAAAVVEERAVYLGPLHGHFGHFLLESLGRSWALRELGPGVKAVFHFANYPGAILPPSALEHRLPSFVRQTFAALGIGLDQLILANRDIRFRELIVPTNQLWLMLHCGRGAMAVYDHFREAVGPGPRLGPRRVYLSRRRLDVGEGRKTPKSIGNEADVERLLLARGFEAVALETLSLPEQVRLIAGASHIVGPTGSAMHMAVFNSRPETRVISLDWRDVRSQYMVEAARGCDAAHICCLAGRDERGARILDTGLIDQALNDLRV